MAQEKTLETAFGELEKTINQMEKGELTLDESFKLYQEGVQLLKYCNDSIDKIEKKIIELRTEDAENEF